MTSLFTKITAWAGERLRYLVRWPVNLVRDFPTRLIRLFQTGYRVLLGLLFSPAELIDALRYHETRRWLRFKSGRIIDWSHQLLAQLFDIVGGPEVAQFVFHFLTNTTPLTANEIDMMSDILGPDALQYAQVRVAQGGFLRLIFKLNGNLAFATWRTVNLPQHGRHTRENRALLAHELTHVYQYEQVGSRYLGEAIYMLIKTKRDCYEYGGRSGLVTACALGVHYADYNREQQAMIVQDYCALQQLGADVSAYEPYIKELQSGLV